LENIFTSSTRHSVATLPALLSYERNKQIQVTFRPRDLTSQVPSRIEPLPCLTLSHTHPIALSDSQSFLPVLLIVVDEAGRRAVVALNIRRITELCEDILCEHLA